YVAAVPASRKSASAEGEALYRPWHRLALLSPDPREGFDRERGDRMARLKAGLVDLQERLMGEVGEPSLEELRDWTAGHEQIYKTTERVDLQSIYLRQFDGERMESVEERAGEVAGMLERGESFQRVATLYSDATSRAIGGSS